MIKKLGILITALLFAIVPFTTVNAGDMTKVQKFSHSVTENGKIQVRMITEYVQDGKVVNKKTGPAMTPEDTSNMEGWDQESQDIVAAITSPEATEAFAAEKQTPTGTGLETIVSYDRSIDALGRISVRRITRIYDDGKVISKKFHRSWIMPDQDASTNDVMSKAVANKIHTQIVKDAYAAKQLELNPPPVAKTLDQQKAIKLKDLYANIKSFINTLPDGMPRYDADLKMNLMNKSVTAVAAGNSKPAKVTLAETWIMTVQVQFIEKKAAIEASTNETELDAVDITVANLESKYGREGTVLVDPGVSTADLME